MDPRTPWEETELPGMPEKPTDKLYGKPGDEYLHRDPFDVWQGWHDDGGDGSVEIEEWSTTGFGAFVWSADLIVEHVVDHAGDEVLSEEAYETLVRASKKPEVVAAFEKARTALLEASSTGWLFADELLRTGTATTVFEDDRAYPSISWKVER